MIKGKELFLPCLNILNSIISLILVDDLSWTIKCCKSGRAKIFQTTKTIFRKPYKPITINNEYGHHLGKDTDIINKWMVLGSANIRKYPGNKPTNWPTVIHNDLHRIPTIPWQTMTTVNLWNSKSPKALTLSEKNLVTEITGLYRPYQPEVKLNNNKQT